MHDTYQHTTLLQWPIVTSCKNDTWGNKLVYENPLGLFRVVSKNVGTLNTQALDMLAITTEWHQMDAGIVLAQETNTA